MDSINSLGKLFQSVIVRGKNFSDSNWMMLWVVLIANGGINV